MSTLEALIVGFAGSIAGCLLIIWAVGAGIDSRRPLWVDWLIALAAMCLNVSGWIVAVIANG